MDNFTETLSSFEVDSQTAGGWDPNRFVLAVCLNQTAVLAVALSTAASVALFAAWGGLGKLERQFYEGWDVPLRNLPQKK